MEFMKLKQDNMSMRKYALKFSKLSNYSPSVVAGPRDRMNKFIASISYLGGVLIGIF